ncbi:MAG: serine/threonine protein kinase, partial [Proteobacteria bacterium]
MIETLIGQRYRIKALIGEGGMASVYSAMDEKLERRVAIKILHPHLARNPDIRERFLLEAKTVSGLDHPNIMRVYDFSGLDSDQLWMVNEILYGEDLAEYVKAFPKQRLQFIVASLITREICRALHEAHKLNIVHRDIKPENIMMLTNGQIKLMDFGIAKVHRANATQTGIFMGSPSYMSPEQIRGTDVDSRADIYSLSVLYYEIVTGTLPFVGKTTAEVINRIMVGRYTPPNMLITDLPFALNSIIVKGMQGHKEDRFQSVTEMGQAIDTFLTNCQMRESRTELEEFSQNRAKFEERLSQIISTKPKGPSPVAIPLEEMSPTFRSKITRYHASYEEQMQAMEAEKAQTIADHLSPLSPTGEGQDIPTSTIILDESSVPTLPPMREARAAMQAMEEAAKASLNIEPVKVAPQAQAPKQQQVQQQQQPRQAQDNNFKPMTVAPQQKHRQTSGNFQSPMRPGTQPPKTPQSNPRTTQQRGYYREFEEEKKSNWGLILAVVLVAAVALGFVFSSDKLLNRMSGKPDKVRPTPGESLANKPKKPKAEEIPVQTVAVDPTPEPEEPAVATPPPTAIESQTIVVPSDGKTKPKIPTVVPTVKQSIFSKQPPKPVAKADPTPAKPTP